MQSESAAVFLRLRASAKCAADFVSLSNWCRQEAAHNTSADTAKSGQAELRSELAKQWLELSELYLELAKAL